MNTVIYYPDVPTPEWLRLAALSWDQVYLLSFHGPPGIGPSLRELDHALGGVLRVIDGDAFKRSHPELKHRLREWILSRTKGLGFELSELNDENSWDPDWIALNYMYQLINSNLSSDRELIRRENRAVVAQAEGLYAVTAAEADGRDVSTTNDKYTEAVFHHERVLRGEVAKAVIEAYVPEKLLSMDPERIADLRSELSIKRLKFQKEIQQLCGDFAGVSSADQLEDLKRKVVDMANENIEATKTTYRRAKIDVLLKSFAISLTPPALGASLASLLGLGIIVPLGIASTLSLFAAKSLLDIRKARSERDQSPWSYILDVGESLQ